MNPTEHLAEQLRPYYEQRMDQDRENKRRLDRYDRAIELLCRTEKYMQHTVARLADDITAFLQEEPTA